jgi:hypothetical protein
MRQNLALTLLLVLFALSGCVRSLAPLFTEKEMVFEPKLVGTWNVGTDDDWTFSRHGERGYTLSIFQQSYSPTLMGNAVRGDTAAFDAILGRLDDELFLDLSPITNDRAAVCKKNDFFNWHFAPAHSMFRVRFVHDSLRLTMLDSRWMEKLIDEKKLTIAHYQKKGDGIILTASTEELQSFVRQYANDDNAFLPLDRVGHDYH